MAGVGFITEKQFEIMFDITPLERGKSAPKPSVGKKQAAAVTQERSASADHAGTFDPISDRKFQISNDNHVCVVIFLRLTFQFRQN